MAQPYHESVVMLIPLQNNLDDYISPPGMSELSGQSPEYTSLQRFDFTSGTMKTFYGLQFTDDNEFVSDGIPPIVDNYSVSFWYYSPAPLGFTRNANTNRNQELIAPIIGQGWSNPSGSFLQASACKFLIAEAAASKTQNRIRLEISIDTDVGIPLYRYESEPFNPGLHHVMTSVWTVNTTVCTRIDIDGKLGETNYQTSDPIVGQSNAPLRINGLYHGPIAHLKKQNGAAISEIVIRDSVQEDCQKAYMFGWQSISETGEYSDIYDYIGVGYDQPSTVTTNQIWAEGGNIYIARSNGEILKGTRPIWDTEVDFPEASQDLTGKTSRI